MTEQTKTATRKATKEDIDLSWQDCFIIGLPRVRTKKKLMEAFDLGITIMKRYEIDNLDEVSQ